MKYVVISEFAPVTSDLTKLYFFYFIQIGFYFNLI